METLYRRKQVDCRWRENRKSFHLLHKTIYIRVTCCAHVHGLCKHSMARPYTVSTSTYTWCQPLPRKNIVVLLLSTEESTRKRKKIQGLTKGNSSGEHFCERRKLARACRRNQGRRNMMGFEWSDEGVSEIDGYEAAANSWILNFS